MRFRFFFQEDSVGNGHGNRFYLDDIQFTTTVGLNELQRELRMKVYPNPAKGVFDLAFALEAGGVVESSLTDIAGAKLIQHPAQTFDAGDHRFRFDISDLAPGVYFVQLRVNGKTVQCKVAVE